MLWYKIISTLAYSKKYEIDYTWLEYKLAYSIIVVISHEYNLTYTDKLSIKLEINVS